MPAPHHHLLNPLLKKTCLCTILPPTFKIFQSPPPRKEIIHPPPPALPFQKNECSELWSAIYLSLCIFKVYLQNQSKQCAKGSYIISYWSTVDEMWCFIYYHLDVSRGFWGETCNHNFQPLKLIKQDLSTFFVVTFSSDIFDMLYRGYYWFY